MSSDAPIQADPYLSSKEAGKLLGYTHDYISKLCRDGKMAGIQRGRVWFVTEAEARAFQVRHEAELEEKKALLSQKFSAIRQRHESNRSEDFAQTLPGAMAIAEEAPISKPAHIQEPVVQSVPQPAEKPVQAYSNPISAITFENDEPEVAETKSFDMKDSVPEQQQIQFAMPKHFVALAVLALILLAPSFMSGTQSQTASQATYRTNSQTTVRTATQPTQVSDIMNNLDSGVATVIATQSELVSKTANTYGFLQYLSDGYWEIAVSMGELWSGVYGFLQTISDSYLAFYEFQGETIYYSFGNIRGMGATVLQGYELVGESVVVGVKNALESYRNFFMVDSYIENSLKKN